MINEDYTVTARCRCAFATAWPICHMDDGSHCTDGHHCFCAGVSTLQFMPSCFDFATPDFVHLVSDVDYMLTACGNVSNFASIFEHAGVSDPLV